MAVEKFTGTTLRARVLQALNRITPERRKTSPRWLNAIMLLGVVWCYGEINALCAQVQDIKSEQQRRTPIVYQTP